MKLVAKVVSSQETLEIPGLDKPKTIKNGHIFEITFKINEWVDVPKEVFEFKDKVFLINIAERGGTCEGKTYAQVVTGASGKPLKPFFIPRKTIKACGDHAFFSVPEECYSIETNNGNDVILKKNVIEVDEENLKAKLSSNIIYQGDTDNIPEEHIRFKKPAEICLDKANCDECKFIYYFVDPSQHKPQQFKKAA